MQGEFPEVERDTPESILGDQERLQRGVTGRCRTVDDYGFELGLGRERMHGRLPMMDFVDAAIATRGECVWADFGSGNNVALRQAKLRLAQAGKDPDRLRTYGVDVLPVSASEIQAHINGRPDEYEAELLEERWAAHVQADATTVELPEPADIVTGVQLLQWTADPVEIMRNALRQLRSGGTIGMGAMNRVHYTEEPPVDPDPESILWYAEKTLMEHLRGSPWQPIPGLAGIVENNSTLLATKTGNTPTLDELRLLLAAKASVQGYRHLYTAEPATAGRAS
jgi:hypothetical protein